MLVLKISKISGVGVFTLDAIPIGAPVALFDPDDHAFIRPQDATGKLYEWFCLRNDQGFICPLDFNRMSIGWYMNQSERPNIIVKEGRCVAGVFIRKDDELTVNYWELHKLFPQ